MSARNEPDESGESAGQRGSEREDAQSGPPEADDVASDLTPAGPGSRRARREARGDVASERVSPLPFLLAGAVVVLLAGVLIWWFVLREVPEESVAEERNDSPGIDGIIQRNADPEEWLAGDCLSGFESEHAPATVIECDHYYDRQVIHWGELEDDSYPGDDQVPEQAVALCEDGPELDQDEVDSVDYELEVEVSHPSRDTWTSEGDRRVNCLLRRVDGAELSGNFVVDPEGESSAEDFEDDDGGADDDGAELDAEDGGEDTEEDDAQADDADAEPQDDGEDQDDDE